MTLWRRPPAPQVPPRQRKTRKISAQALLEDVGRYPDAYCCERAQRFGCSHTAIHKALKRYGISCKKKTGRHPKAGRRLRKNFLKLLHRYILRNRPVVCSDGSKFGKSCYRPYAYAPKSRRCYALHDWQGHHQTNAVGALFHGKLFAVGLFDCSIDRRIFDAWVERVLIPELPQNSVAVMGNAAFHKGKAEALLKEKGHTVLWLPPYSPDLNQIEKKRAWIKGVGNRLRMADVDWLFQACIDK
ncbi:transposase [Neisseria weixii]|uniref:transposase n=1 Tax=Neisseria weixii TaxID=1853276 RepID=UPI0039F555DB